MGDGVISFDHVADVPMIFLSSAIVVWATKDFLQGIIFMIFALAIYTAIKLSKDGHTLSKSYPSVIASYIKFENEEATSTRSHMIIPELPYNFLIVFDDKKQMNDFAVHLFGRKGCVMVYAKKWCACKGLLITKDMWNKIRVVYAEPSPDNIMTDCIPVEPEI